jgi:hypothetical protein
VTVRDQDGKEVFSSQKEYFVYDFHFAENKEGYLGLDHWDITAMDHIKTGIEPKKTDSEVFVVPLTEDTKSVDIEAAFTFVYEEGKIATIHKVNKKVEFTK